MFILKIDDLDIKPCLLCDSSQDSQEVVLGIIYLNLLLIPVEFYSKDNLKRARQKCQELLQLENPKFSIITESSEQLIVWSTSETLKKINSVKKAVALV